MIYRLILAGFDCAGASVCTYGYNISVIVKKRKINVLGKISYDRGDILALKEYFPAQIQYRKVDRDIAFNGNIKKLNW